MSLEIISDGKSFFCIDLNGLRFILRLDDGGSGWLLDDLWLGSNRLSWIKALTKALAQLEEQTI